TGQYNIIYINKERIDLISDFVGMKAVYYHFGEKIYISNNIHNLKKHGFMIDQVGYVQSMIPRLYGPLNKRSLLVDIYTLRNGEYLCYYIKTKRISAIIDSMDMENKTISSNTVDDF